MLGIIVIIFSLLCIFVALLDRPRAGDGSRVIRTAISCGNIVGSVIFLIYGAIGRHDFILGNWLWCVACFFVASLVVDWYRGKSIRW
jgi:hypothetical protein